MSWTGTRCVEVYNLEGQIGQGTYGSVYSATSKYRPGRFALKRIHPSKSSKSLSLSFYREIVVLRQITHQNLVPLLEIVTSKFSVGSGSGSAGSGMAEMGFNDDKDNSAEKEGGPAFAKGDLYMVFEYMDHDLAGLLNAGYKFSVPQIRCLMHQLLEVLDYLHTEKQLMHRDIKCSNLLIGENMQLKLADFGLARFANREDGRYTNRVITLWYRPPELLLGEEHYTFSVDIWSVGCIMAELLLGSPAFQAKKEMDQLEAIWAVCGTPTDENWPDHKALPMWNNPYTPKHPIRAQMSSKWKKNIVSEIEKRSALFGNSASNSSNVNSGETNIRGGVGVVGVGVGGVGGGGEMGCNGGMQESSLSSSLSESTMGSSNNSISGGNSDNNNNGAIIDANNSCNSNSNNEGTKIRIETGAMSDEIISGVDSVNGGGLIISDQGGFSPADDGNLLYEDCNENQNDPDVVANYAIMLLERLLALDPSRRFSARAAKEDAFFMSDQDSLHWQNLDKHQKIDTGGSFHEWETKQMLKELPPGSKNSANKLLVNNKKRRFTARASSSSSTATATISGFQSGSSTNKRSKH
jgi:serine/threonine protein kinase